MTSDLQSGPRSGGAPDEGPAARPGPRRIALLTHPGRDVALAAAEQVSQGLRRLGLEPEILLDERVGEGVELVVVLGGDGTILRAAELVRGTRVPLLGINLGHVGFLAEAEREDLDGTVARIAARDWHVEERMTLEIEVHAPGGGGVQHQWALNEVSLEKAARERMLEVLLEIDGRPVTEYGCDGLVVSTPTGSTAYAFSAGGPVVWPEVEAVLVVPISAHALFARPLVIAPTSTVVVEVLAAPPGMPGVHVGPPGIMWCDGRRGVDLVSGSRVVVRRSDLPVRLARLGRAPFADRLVAKFDLPVRGWRGRHRVEAVDEAAGGAAD